VANNGTSSWDPNSGAAIMGDMQYIPSVTMGGDGVIYMMTGVNNDLVWWKNWFEGSPNLYWQSSRSHLSCFKNFWQPSYLALIPGGDGTVYVLDTSGNLYWFRDTANNGTVSPDPNAGVVIASGLPTQPPASGMIPVWAGENGAFYSISGGTLQVHQLSIGIDGIPSVTTTAGPAWNSSAAWAASPLTPTNVGCGVMNLCNTLSSGIGYPAFSGTQAVCYQDICEQAGKVYNSSSFDLRTAYGNPAAYPPSQLLTSVSAAKPTNKESKTDWAAVQAQLEAETSQLGVIYTYQTNATANAEALATAYQLSYQTATGNISGGGDMTLDLLTIMSFMAIPGLEVDAFLCQMAGLIAAIAQAQGSATLSGPLSQLNLYTFVTGLLDTVKGLYQQLQPDWGKVQAANQLLQHAETASADETYAQMGNAYEVGLYIASALSSMCILYANQWKAWGSCGGNGVGLAFIPDPDEGPKGANGNVCDRLTALGVQQQNIINRIGPWGGLPRWQCTWFSGSDGGWTCQLYN
jgi:hypothetical protein